MMEGAGEVSAIHGINFKPSYPDVCGKGGGDRAKCIFEKGDLIL